MIVAVVGSFLAALVAVVLVGAYVPAIPKVGVIGPVLGGQYLFHLAGLAVVGLVLAVVARRAGLVRWGRVIVVVAGVATAGAVVIGAVQFRGAQRVGADVSWADVATELAYPATTPDETTTYASPDGSDLDVDVYLPDDEAGDGTVPAVVMAHAGGFRTFDKSDLRGTARWLADHGVAAFAIDYRLATPLAPTWDQAPQDLVCALGWVREHADQYGVDTSRVSLAGFSAGGTLALGAGYRLQNGTIASSCGPTPEPPDAVVGFYPGTDVEQMWDDDVAGSREAADEFTGGTPKDYPDRYREVSPTSDVRDGLPRTLLVVGDRDRSARPETVAAFADVLRGHDVDTRLEVLPFAEHAFDDAYGSLLAQTSRQILLDFLLT